MDVTAPATVRPTKTRRYLLAAVGLIVVWAALDLAGPQQSDLTSFDPEVVARLETAMWRSYYDRRPVLLFSQLAQTLRRQYGVPFLRSYAIAFRGAKAAFIFKDGQSRTDYERALPDLIRYYRAIEAISSTRFDSDRVASLELEWWIVHRQRDSHTFEQLALSLADLQAAIYVRPSEPFYEHGRLRAEAMLMRDEKAVSGGVAENDWTAINALLDQSWRELWNQVQPPRASQTP
jgi:hypothetical protein